jgi:hypothetical protein
MTEEQLIAEYGAWGEHPDHMPEDWQSEVANGDTRRGYWSWVAVQIEQDGDG